METNATSFCRIRINEPTENGRANAYGIGHESLENSTGEGVAMTAPLSW